MSIEDIEAKALTLDPKARARPSRISLGCGLGVVAVAVILFSARLSAPPVTGSTIRHAVRDESESTGPRTRAAVRLESGAVPVALALRPELSWHHYRLLLRVEREGM